MGVLVQVGGQHVWAVLTTNTQNTIEACIYAFKRALQLLIKYYLKKYMYVVY